MNISLELIKESRILSIFNQMKQHLQGKEKSIILSLISFFSRGHLLIEDAPGLGKTTLSLVLAKTLGLEFGRLQGSSDLLPSDITGLTIYNKDSNKFEFKSGPIFKNIILFDEINRTNPKTQSALLEAMEENQITIDSNTYKLPDIFFVIATQNSFEHHGTFPLPDSQLDRFLMKISIGYPNYQDEIKIILSGSKREDIDNIKPIINISTLKTIFEDIKKIYISDKIADYIVKIVQLTREEKLLYYGLSTRAALSLKSASQTIAFFSKRDYVLPEDIKFAFNYVVPHRVRFINEFNENDQLDFLNNLFNKISVPI